MRIIHLIIAILPAGLYAQQRIAGHQVAAPIDCRFGTSGVHYDLRPLMNQGPFTVQNSYWHANANWNYTYSFEICKDVEEPSTHSPRNMCSKTRGEDNLMLSGPAAGFQVFNSDDGHDDCHRLGASVSREPPRFGLFDKFRPADGVTMLYTGGDKCTDDMGQQRDCKKDRGGADGYCDRELMIIMLCDQQTYDVPSNEKIEEADGCHFEVTLNSVYGCPTECWDGNTVCNDRGVCGYDWEGDGRARCFCEVGFEGDTCQLTDSGVQALMGVLIAICLFGLTISVTFYLLREKGLLVGTLGKWGPNSSAHSPKFGARSADGGGAYHKPSGRGGEDPEDALRL